MRLFLSPETAKNEVKNLWFTAPWKKALFGYGQLECFWERLKEKTFKARGLQGLNKGNVNKLRIRWRWERGEFRI